RSAALRAGPVPCAGPARPRQAEDRGFLLFADTTGRQSIAGKRLPLPAAAAGPGHAVVVRPAPAPGPPARARGHNREERARPRAEYFAADVTGPPPGTRSAGGANPASCAPSCWAPGGRLRATLPA